MVKNIGIYNLNEVRELLAAEPNGSVTVPTVDTEFPVSEIASLDQSRWRDYPDYVTTVEPSTSGVVFQSEILPPIVHLIDNTSGTDLSTIRFTSRYVHDIVGDQLDIKLFHFDTMIRESVAVITGDQRQFTFNIDDKVSTINTTFAVKLFADQHEILDFELSGVIVTLAKPLAVGVTLTIVLGIDSVPTIFQLTEGVDYVVVNNHLIHWNYLISAWVPYDSMGFIVIQPQLPQYSQVAPLRLIDNISKSIVKPINRWDPGFDLHDGSVAQCDIIATEDPAVYTTDKTSTKNPNQWTVAQVGTYWWDTTLRKYRPYNDQHIASFDQGTSSWGQLFETAENVVYQWVKSNKRPTLLINSEVTPYSRVLSKTRLFNDIAVWSGGSGQTTFTSIDTLNFVTGKYVSMYTRSDSTTKSKTSGGVTLGLPYIITVTSPTTFTLQTEAGEPVIATNAPVGDFRIADSDWSIYPSIEEPILYQTFYAYDNCVYPSPVVNPVFTFTDPAIVRRLVDDNITVWLNGAITGYSFDLTTKTLTLVDEVGDPTSSLVPQDIITVLIPQPTPNITRTDGDLIDTNNATTVYVVDYPYSETSDGLVSTYYYWVRGYTLVPPTKQFDTTRVESDLTTGGGNAFFALRNPQRSANKSKNSGHYVYDMLTVKGLFDMNNPSSLSLAIDLDPNIRTQFTSDTHQKTAHDQWVMFRPSQRSKIVPFIWQQLKQTVVGVNSSAQIVPSATRSTYDFINATNTRYGTGHDQTLIDTVLARELLLDYLTVVKFDGVDNQPIDEILALPLNTPSDYGVVMDQLYQTCAPTTINNFIFLILNVALYSGHELGDVMKTSYISLDASHRVVMGGST